MKKGIIIYYSFEGTTKYISELMKYKLDFDILEIKPISELKSKGFSKYIWGVSQVFMKKEPKLDNYDNSFLGYKNIILASPVWAGTFAPPIKSFLSKEKKHLKDKNMALIACHDGGPGSIFKNFKKEIENCNFIGELSLEKAKKNLESTENLIDNWIKLNYEKLSSS